MRRTALRRPESLTDKYRILGKIGEGTYGIVYKAEAQSSALLPRPSSSGSANNDDDEPQTFAIKLVKSHKEGKNDVVLSSATVREIKLLRELQHDNIVHLHDVHVDPQEKLLALVFEYADHDLHDIIVQSKQKPLGEYTKKSLMYQILKGVDYMHDSWVMHRDMKPQNILVVGHGRKRGQVKLADFGLARLYKEPIKALSDVERVVVTLWYRAPELLLGAKHYTKAVDLWAVGCIFAEIINTRELFCGKEVEGSNAPFQKDQLDKIFKVLGMPTPQTWEGLDNLPEYNHVVQMGRERKYPSQSELKNAVKFGGGRSGAALYDLISRLLEYDPEARITAKEALEHEYFKDIEPEPRDWSFDEPGKEPISFRTQNIEPISEEQLPWKTRKDPIQPGGDPGAKAGDASGAGGSPHRDRHHSSSSQHNDATHRRDNQSRSRSHHGSSSSAAASRDPNRRSDRPPGSDVSTRDDGRGNSNTANRNRKSWNQTSGNPRDDTNAGGSAGSSAAGGTVWRDRSAGRGESTRSSTSTSNNKRTSSDRPSAGGDRASGERTSSDRTSGERPPSASRPRSPKQQRRR